MPNNKFGGYWKPKKTKKRKPRGGKRVGQYKQQKHQDRIETSERDRLEAVIEDYEKEQQQDAN